MKKVEIDMHDIRNDVSVDATPINITPEDISPKPIEEPNYKDLYIKSLADYQNMKRFTDNQIANMKRFYLGENIEKIISPLYDDLYRGVKNGVDGCEMILNNLKNSLEKVNVCVIDNSIIGNEFNTDTMNAITSINTNNKEMIGTVADVIGFGFIDKETNKTLVYAKVVVYN